MRIYNASDLSAESEIELLDNDHHHLRNVLRKKLGDEVAIFNANGGEWIALVTHISKHKTIVKLKKLNRKPIDLLHKKKIGLIFAIVKKDTSNRIVRQATEMGVDLIQPINTQFSNYKFFDKDKSYLWAKEASEQTGRLTVPEIMPVLCFDEICEVYKEYKIYMADESLAAGDNLGFCNLDVHSSNLANNIALIVGPEGGFSPKELNAKGFVKIGLGCNILKVDTAVVAGLSYIKSFCL